MRHAFSRAASVFAASLMLSACGGSDSGGSSAGGRTAVVAPQPATGDGCLGIHGDPPRETAPSVQGQAASLYYLAELCTLRGGEKIEWTDPDSTPRLACLFESSASSAENPLPLVTFLGGSIFPGDIQTVLGGLEFRINTADLTADPARPGFNLLVVEGRDKEHFYPFPDDHALGFDNWYRNFDRDDPEINVDVATIDHYIAEVEARGVVDPKRKYMMGWSNGAAMSILYALNTPGIAASAVYSSPDPFVDSFDPCAQLPFGNNLRPVMTVHNSCDIIGICQSGSVAFRGIMATTLPQVELRSVIIDPLQGETDACVAACAYDGNPLQLASPGSVLHLRWPLQWNDEFFAFLRDRPLP